MPETPRTSRDLLILVEQSTEPVSPSDGDRLAGCPVGEWSYGSGLAERAVWPMAVVAAPRGAALYRSRSGQGREEMSLDLMADPVPKG